MERGGGKEKRGECVIFFVVVFVVIVIGLSSSFLARSLKQILRGAADIDFALSSALGGGSMRLAWSWSSLLVRRKG